MEIRPVIFYKTTADFDNTGEVLIYKTLLENLRTYGDVVVDDSPKIQALFLERIGIRDTEKLHTYTKMSFLTYIIVSSLKNFFLRRPVYFATGVGDHVVCGAKGAIKNICSFFFMLFLKLCGVNVIRIGMSIKFKGKIAAFSERLLSLVIPFYYVRDGISLYNCRKNKVKASIAPDLSWGYRVNGLNNANTASNLVIISFRDYIHKQTPEPYKTLLYAKIGLLLKHICKNKNKSILLAWQCDYDKQVLEEIYDRFCDLGNIQLANELITLQNAQEYYGKASIVLTNRLHVMLLGYKYGALTVGLTDIREHTKIYGIFKDEQLENHLIDINSTDDDICSSYDSLALNLNAEWGKMHDVEFKNYMVLKDIFQLIFLTGKK